MVMIIFETVKATSPYANESDIYNFCEINGNIYNFTYGTFQFVMDAHKTKEEVYADADKYIKSKGWG